MAIAVPTLPRPAPTVATAGAGTTGAEGSGEAPSTLAQRLLQPGWPLAAILVPFPLWWALGLSEWIVPVMVLPMVVHLLRRSTVLAPKGFGWWVAFLLWVAVGGFLLQVDALGAVPDDSRTRIITFCYRLAWYLSITVVLLYIVNTWREFSSTRITRIVAAMFVTVTAGGLLGVVAPYFQFQSLAELVLPGALTKVQLIHSMIHPQAAQLQGVLGYVSPRPAAPFTFTNTWGLNFAVTLPFFVFAWLGKDAGWRRWAAAPVLLVAAVPLIYSLNRGLWGACVAMALFVAARAALTGRPGLLAGILAGAAVFALLLAVSPLGHIVSLRFANKGSEEGRTHLATLTVRSVTATSPVVGLGSTRNVQGNFQSITGGSTAQCPRCSPPALGTQGQLWLVVFSQGLVGLVLFLTFFGLIFLRHIRLRSPVATASLSALVAWAVTLPVYNSLGMGMLIVMVAAALLCREGSSIAGPLPSLTDRSVTLLGRYSSALSAGIPVILLFSVAGTAAGWAWVQHSPSLYKGTASVLLDDLPNYSSSGAGRINVDTEAQLVASNTVRNAAASASHEPLTEVADHLTVTATPNSRLLHLQFTAGSAGAAKAGVDAATNAFIKLRAARLEADRSAELARLRKQVATLATSLSLLNQQVQSARQQTTSDTVDLASAVARDHRNELLPQIDVVSGQAARVAGLVLSGGRRTDATLVTRSKDRLEVDLVSGATAGLALGAFLVFSWGRGGPRLRRVKDVRGNTGLPLLATVGSSPNETTAVAELLADRPMAYVTAVEGDARAAAVVDRLTALSGWPTGRTGAVVVASGRTRVDAVRACQARLTLQGIPVRGVVLTTGPTRLPRPHPRSQFRGPGLEDGAILRSSVDPSTRRKVRR